jgi:hypothetical protein
MNLDERYRPPGDFIIEDADHQPAGIPSLCIEVCPTFYRDWTIPVLVMPVHDMSRAVTALIGALVDLPQQLLRILRGERQIRIDAGVHVDPAFGSWRVGSCPYGSPCSARKSARLLHGPDRAT